MNFRIFLEISGSTHELLFLFSLVKFSGHRNFPSPLLPSLTIVFTPKTYNYLNKTKNRQRTINLFSIEMTLLEKLEEQIKSGEFLLENARNDLQDCEGIQKFETKVILVYCTFSY